jgi:hypothetical protein
LLGIGGGAGSGILAAALLVVLLGVLAAAAGTGGRLAGGTLAFVLFIHEFRLLEYFMKIIYKFDY